MKRITTAAVLFAASGSAFAQFSTGFEAPAYAGSAGGTDISGQDGWYLAPIAGSIPASVFTYEGNALGIPANPTGGAQFEGGMSQGGTAFVRAQKDIDFSGSSQWRAAWDIAVAFVLALPSAPNLGSFSLQDNVTSISWQTLYNFVDVNTPEAWNCRFMPYNAFGVQVAQPGIAPDPAFENLAVGTWYRVRVDWDFSSNRITETAITNLATGQTVTVQPTDWYMTGGTSPTLLIPTAYRHFVGGGAGNVVAIDNFSIEPLGGGGGCDPDYDQNGVADQDDVAYLVNVIAGGENPTNRDPDFDQNGVADQDDYAALVNVVAGGPCP